MRYEGRWRSGNERREKLGEGVGGIFQRGKEGLQGGRLKEGMN